MASATPNYGFIKPDTGDQGWGDTVNSDLDAIDVAIHEVATGGIDWSDVEAPAISFFATAGDFDGSTDTGHTATLSVVGGGSVAARNSGVTISGTTVSVNGSDISHMSTTLAAKADLTGGLVPTAELGSGSATSSTFLRGDQTWQTVTSGISIDGAGTGAVAAAHSSDTVTASSTQAIAIGKNASANTGAEAIAIGGGVSATAAPQATGQGAIAIGASDGTSTAGSRAPGPGAVAIGSGDATTAAAAANGSYSAAYGFNALAATSYSVAIGAVTNSNQSYNVALGSYAQATTGAEAIAIGGGQNATSAAAATDQGAIAIGASNASGVNGAKASTPGSIAIGSGTATNPGAAASGNTAVAIGFLSIASGGSSTAVGQNSTASGSNSMAYGTIASASATDAIAIGDSSAASQVDAIAIGDTAAASGGVAAIAVGALSVASTTQCIAIGKRASANTGAQAIAIGSGTNATAAPQSTSQGAIAIGASNASGVAGARGAGIGAVAIGSGDASIAGATANAASVAIGSNSSCASTNSVALGYQANSSAGDTITVGLAAAASVTRGIAIGRQAQATTGNEAIAIGSGQNTTASPNATAQGAIAIGASDASGVAGARAAGANGVAIGSGDGSVAGASASSTGAVAIGKTALASNTASVAIGTSTTSSGSLSTAVGYASQATQTSSTAIGTGATASVANQIMLGTSTEDVVAAGSFAIRTPYRVLQLVDDFIGQNTANGDVGQLGWRTGGTGSSTSVNPGETNHPGIQVLSTGATSGFNRFLSTGDSSNQSFIATDVDRFIGILRPVTVTSVTIYFGLLQDSQTTPPGTAGVYFTFDPAVNANWQTVTRNASTSTTNTSAIAGTANNWYQLEGRRNGSNWEMYINGSLKFTHSTNLPTAAVSPCFFIATNTTANRDLHCDFFALTSSVLGQRWT